MFSRLDVYVYKFMFNGKIFTDNSVCTELSSMGRCETLFLDTINIWFIFKYLFNN